MTAGRLAAAKPAATTNTTLYQCPINKATSAVLEVCNQGGSASSYSVALRDYNQVLTLDASTYSLQQGNIITAYQLEISPGISTDQVDPGTTLSVLGNTGNFIYNDVIKPTATITYPVRLESLGSVSVDSASLTGGTFSVGDTITGTSGLTATIYRVGAGNFIVKIPNITAGATSAYISDPSNILANDYIAVDDELIRITAITGSSITITRGQFGTTAAAKTPGLSALVLRPSGTTTTVSEGATFSDADTTLTVADASGLIIGNYLQIDNEFLLIQSITSNDVQVTRGALGTTAATHNNAAAITEYQGIDTTYFQFFALDETVTNGTASIDLQVGPQPFSVFDQQDQFVFDLSNTGVFQSVQFIPVDANRTVRFTQEHSSNVGHRLRFSLTNDGTFAAGVEYTTGVVVAGTLGSAGAYTEINLSSSNIGGNNTIYYYCEFHSGEGGYLNIDLTPNYSNILIYDVNGTLQANDSFRVNNVTYTITDVTSGPYGYVMGVNGADVKVSLGIGSSAFQANDTFYDSPLTDGEDRLIATVDSSVELNSEDLIVSAKSISANSSERMTSIVVGPGQNILVNSGSANISYVVQGFEDTTTDFNPRYYVRDISSTPQP